MYRGTTGINSKHTASGNDYKQPNDHADASGSGRYRHCKVRQANTPPRYIPGHSKFNHTPDTCSSNYPVRDSVKPVYDFNALITQDKIDCLVRVSARYGDRYAGIKHSQFAISIKQYTSASKRHLNHSEQRQLIPLLYDFKPTPGWTWRSLTTTLHSFTSAGVFTPHKYMDKRGKEAQAALLSTLLDAVILKCNQKPEARDIDVQGIANLVWVMAKLVDNGLELEKTPKLKEAVAALLPHVKTKAESKQEKDQFIPQNIANMLWALAKLVDNGLELEKTAQLKEVVAALLFLVKTKAKSKEEKHHFKPQEVANLLLAMAKLVDNGLELEKTPQLKEAVTVLLPHVKTKAGSKQEKDQFIPQNIANMLWALAKLVDNGLELEKTAQLKEVVAALLFLVKTKAEAKEGKDHFKLQEVANLLWALVILVGNGLGLGKTAQLKEALAALLIRVKTKAESKEEKDYFIPQDIATLLWAVAKLGEAIELNLVKSTFDSLVDRISEKHQFSQQGISMSLWRVMAFCARFYLYYGKDDKNSLEKHIGELFSRLENTSTSNPEVQSIIAMAASWLGKACPVTLHYTTIISQSQSTFRNHLQSSLPSLKIEEEKSLNSLPPVDLLLPDYNMVIDVQGPSHYVDSDFKTRNGSTLLKIALLQKLGFEVITIPVSRLDDQNSMKIVIDQIKTKLVVPPEPHASVSLNSGEGAADEAYVTADEGGQLSDDCYFTAEEYLEEQTGKPIIKRKKKRIKKRIKTVNSFLPS